jgi:hypothetical protein
VEVVVDHADVLHERVHAGRSHEAYPCDFNCLANASACGVDLARDRGARSLLISRDFASAARSGDADIIARALSTAA